jgi:hypothetical protein
MADVTVVAALVRPLGSTITRRFTAGEAMTPGQPVYISANDTVSLTDGSALGTGMCLGVLIGGAAGLATIASGEECDVCTLGAVTGYSTNMVAGTTFYVDDDAGVISDAVGTKVCVIGVGLNATTMYINPGKITVA